MQLYYSATSPFARKVNMMLHYTGQIENTELVLTNFESDELRRLNPLGKIPALVDGKTTLADSPIICEYLDEHYEQAGNLSVFHCGRGSYYAVQSAHALADGLAQAAVNIVFENKRTTEPSHYWIERWQLAVETAIKNIDLKAIGSASDVNIATLATIAALGYLDFRLGHYPWREWNAPLDNWLESIKNEPWVTVTTPR